MAAKGAGFAALRAAGSERGRVAASVRSRRSHRRWRVSGALLIEVSFRERVLASSSGIYNVYKISGRFGSLGTFWVSWARVNIGACTYSYMALSLVDGILQERNYEFLKQNITNSSGDGCIPPASRAAAPTTGVLPAAARAAAAPRGERRPRKPTSSCSMPSPRASRSALRRLRAPLPPLPWPGRCPR